MRTLLFSCALAAAFTATPAAAQWYVGGGFGQSRSSGLDGPIVASGIPAGATFSGGNSNKTFTKAYVGYQLSPHLGLEAQYGNLGTRDVAARSAVGTLLVAGSAKASQLSLAGVGTLPLGRNFAAIGKIGVTSNKANLNFGGLSIGGNKTSLLVGVGLSLEVSSELALRVEYEDFGKMPGGDGFGGAIRAQAYSVSLKYQF